MEVNSPSLFISLIVNTAKTMKKITTNAKERTILLLIVILFRKSMDYRPFSDNLGTCPVRELSFLVNMAAFIYLSKPPLIIYRRDLRFTQYQIAFWDK